MLYKFVPTFGNVALHIFHSTFANGDLDLQAKMKKMSENGESTIVPQFAFPIYPSGLQNIKLFAWNLWLLDGLCKCLKRFCVIVRIAVV